MREANANLSVKIAKAFVQSDGSNGNGAGIVIIIPNDANVSIRDDDNIEVESLFPSDEECIRIAKHVGLSETSFVALLSSAAIAAVAEKKTAATPPPPTTTTASDNCLIDCASKTTVAAAADFHVKWFTPETEVNLCGHATIALAGYIHSICNNSKNDEYPRQKFQYWKMQCKSGLLGIEIFDDDDDDDDGRTSLPRVVMEQANPGFCEVVDYKEIAESLNINANTDLAIADILIDDGDNGYDKSNRKKMRPKSRFPFRSCEIVSTGGRDLMIPIRSTVLDEINILGRKNKHDGNSNSSSSNVKSIQPQLLCDRINIVSKRYDLVGYHMFEVDDDLFMNNHDIDTDDNSGEIETDSDNNDGENSSSCYKNKNNNNARSPIHLNELISIFQRAEEDGLGSESCLKAVIVDDDDDEDDEDDDQQQQDDNGDINDSKAGNFSNNNNRDISHVVTHNDDIPVDTMIRSRVIRVTGVRSFAPYVGVPEEPATGSANGALSCYLVKHLFLDAYCCSNHQHTISRNIINFRFSIEQGRSMKEPCLIDTEIHVFNGNIVTVKVGGLVKVTGDSIDMEV
jgi:predicted PhzF superfamily epimerase YddE/YHI9